eukprot:TRINITY_DN33121_c0_g1_i1.p1 TRINITY_DN33121_c0_g1~~TRINITY_DN33121_c0_g1_i1.p1  ORF type:complete len:135 (+),score=11.69 TRINITY_DN33121_c0_g1_i1:170-574(+)
MCIRDSTWTAVLRRSPSALLWMIRFPAAEDVQVRLSAELRGSGLAPSRLHMSELFPVEKHIKIKGAADLYIDSFPFGAHSSAIDALWGKVPLLTLPGQSLASRVAFSVVCSVSSECSMPASFKQMEDAATLLIA